MKRKCSFCRKAVKSNWCHECGILWMKKTDGTGLWLWVRRFSVGRRHGGWKPVPDGMLLVMDRWSWARRRR